MKIYGDIPFKRGTAIRWSCTTDVPIVAWGIASKIRAGDGDLLAALSVVITQTSPSGKFRLEYSGDTSGWPLGLSFLDILYTLPDGSKYPTDTKTIAINELQTRVTV